MSVGGHNRAAVNLWLHRIFEAGLLFKAVEAVLELIGGLGLYLVPAAGFVKFAGWLTHAELVEDPHDIVANFLLTLTRGLSIETTHFYAFYMASHAVLKLAIVIALWARIRWAYPAAVVVFAAFIAYQIHRFALTHSPMMIVLSVLDLVVIWLTLREYRTLSGQDRS